MGAGAPAGGAEAAGRPRRSPSAAPSLRSSAKVRRSGALRMGYRGAGARTLLLGFLQLPWGPLGGTKILNALWSARSWAARRGRQRDPSNGSGAAILPSISSSGSGPVGPAASYAWRYLQRVWAPRRRAAWWVAVLPPAAALKANNGQDHRLSVAEEAAAVAAAEGEEEGAGRRPAAPQRRPSCHRLPHTNPRRRGPSRTCGPRAPGPCP